ncbi:MAG: DUF4097 family beta strand repeat protein [Chloroflexi bacterium]|nr:DUF4097 family beta strand repeat protein [Chloroflexota bacterium]
MEWKWNADAFDAVQITTPKGEFEIVGTDTNEVLLECDISSRHLRTEPILRDRWLVVQPMHGAGEWTLKLPKSKAWVLQVAAASGEIEIHDVQARFDLQLGSGEIHIEDCRGTFNVQSGSGDVELENCVQVEAPTVPEPQAPEPEKETAGIPPIPPIPPIPGIKTRRVKINFGNEADWQEYGAQWEEWGERFAEQATRWASKFAREFGSSFGLNDRPNEPGIHVQLGSGDISLEQVDAQLVTFRLGSGDINLEEGRIGEFDVEASRGDMQIENVLPTANWDLTTRHGDIQLVLSEDTNARIDAATRHGDIESDAPLVGVGRPGRAARHGGRMVGTLGQVGDPPIEIHLESLHGDIQIELSGRNSRYAGQPMPPRASKQPATAVAPKPPVPPTPPTPLTTSGAVVPVTVTDLPPTDEKPALKAAGAGPVQVYDSQFAILQALQKGEITVAEAEMLLRSLKN